jgi:transcriptional regulator with XRE-family HTH domain
MNFRSVPMEAMTITVGQRLRWVRQAQEPNPAIFARVMGVSAKQWWKWEHDEERLPVEKAAEAAHRLSVTLDYLYLGRLDIPAPRVLQDLLNRHPELSSAAPPLQ